MPDVNTDSRNKVSVEACGGTVYFERVKVLLGEETIGGKTWEGFREDWIIESQYSNEIWDSHEPSMKLGIQGMIFFSILALITFGLDRWVRWLVKD